MCAHKRHTLPARRAHRHTAAAAAALCVRTPYAPQHTTPYNIGGQTYPNALALLTLESMSTPGVVPTEPTRVHSVLLARIKCAQTHADWQHYLLRYGVVYEGTERKSVCVRAFEPRPNVDAQHRACYLRLNDARTELATCSRHRQRANTHDKLCACLECCVKFARHTIDIWRPHCEHICRSSTSFTTMPSHFRE